jgi:molecular chaperone DnaK (HSP70)
MFKCKSKKLSRVINIFNKLPYSILWNFFTEYSFIRLQYDKNMKKKEVLMNAVGIDLGTSYSCVGVWQNDRVEIIANDQGNRTTPSYVAFTDTEILIGDAAKNQASMNPHNTVFGIHRLIGRNFNDCDVQTDMKVCFIF